MASFLEAGLSKVLLPSSTRYFTLDLTAKTLLSGKKCDVRFFSTSKSRQRQAPRPQDTHPSPSRPKSKLYGSADEAVKDLKDGSTILSAGFGLCGVAQTLIEAIGRRDLKDLTAVSNNTGLGNHGLAHLIKKGQMARLICSYLGGNKELEKAYLNGKIAIELCPQGSLAERIRAGGAGIPAFFTSTGVKTYIQSGQIPIRQQPAEDGTGKPTIIEPGRPRETRIFNNKEYIMEEAITGDVAILRAHKVDEAGNCQLKLTTKTYATIMAKAGTLSIVEADEIVPVGALDPDHVDIPGIYIDRIVCATASKEIESKKLATNEDSSQDVSPAQTRRNTIARRAAKELKDGYYVNLGVGIPTLAASFVEPNVQVWLQSENGILGMGPYPSTEDEVDPDLINAGKETVTLLPGASTFDSADSFSMIRGGHVDVSILGALQVSAAGDLANYMIPGKVFKGMGGAMDLVSNPDQTKIVVATDHVDKNGRSKIVEDCALPLTGKSVVSTIITDLCVFQVDRKKGALTLTELADGVTLEEVKSKTDASFTVSSHITTF